MVCYKELKISQLDILKITLQIYNIHKRKVLNDND